MITPISDSRLIEAPFTGQIDGLSNSAVVNAVMTTDLLRSVAKWRDLHFMFPTVERLNETTWQVAVIGVGCIAFNWVDGFGPVNLHLKE